MVTTANRKIPRLPLDGYLDLTYRCNNNCLHCWLWLPLHAEEAQTELSFAEFRVFVDEARSLGCQAWHLSGGEPMVRPDFCDILEYISNNSTYYSLNTNGTLITPKTARLLVRKGNKMVALYGATAKVHDSITRNPGSFEATMRGCSYMREAQAGFTVQIIPMRANYYQYADMLELAHSLSPTCRVGSTWLFSSAYRSSDRNQAIANQRLSPLEVLSIDEIDPSIGLSGTASCTTNRDTCCMSTNDDYFLFQRCITTRRDFHIDPYGQMSFCCFIKDPELRYDLRHGHFQSAWDEFIPSLSRVIKGGREYHQNCGSCDLRNDCQWCPVYGYLEHGRYSAKVQYLCDIAQETHRYKEEWKKDHLRYYRIAGITIRITSDFPLTVNTFATKFTKFQVDDPGEDVVTLHLISALPSTQDLRLGSKVYQNAPWVIFQSANSWVYFNTMNDDITESSCIGIFNSSHTKATICRDKSAYNVGLLQSLTSFPSDQIVLARVLADRQGCYLHASGIVVDDKGYLFVGHSEAGKSTILKLLREFGEILCDDRMIVRRWPEGFRIHGTWSHGELPDVSPNDAPLKAVFLLEKAPTNELIPIDSMQERLGVVLSHVVKPLVTADWWAKILDLAGKLITEVPFYRLRFDKSGQVVDMLMQL